MLGTCRFSDLVNSSPFGVFNHHFFPIIDITNFPRFDKENEF